MGERVHDLKTWPACWDATKRGEKPWEVRLNDRFYQSGDIVRLHRWEPGVGKNCYVTPDGAKSNFRQEEGTQEFRIGWILQGGQFGIEPGYCVFSLAPIDASDNRAGGQSL